MELPMLQQKNPLFDFAPLALFVLGVQMVVPPLAAVLPDSILQLTSDDGPFVGAELLDHPNQSQVLISRPGLLLVAEATLGAPRCQVVLPRRHFAGVLAAVVPDIVRMLHAVSLDAGLLGAGIADRATQVAARDAVVLELFF